MAAVRKWEMLAATKVKMNDNEKKSEKEQARYFFHKGDVTQDDTQRRFLAQHSVESML